MKKMFFIILSIFFSLIVRGQVITVGPMIHCYFPKGKPKVTVGIEVAIYGVLTFPIPYLQSIDIGFEVGNKVTYWYGEFQLTNVNRNHENFTGLSVGVFRKKESEENAVIGFQSTLWASYFLGKDIRVRLSPTYKDFGVGAFFKYPILFERERNALSKYNE